MSAILSTILGFAGKTVTDYFEDRREYRRQRNEMAANGLASFGGGFVMVTWLSFFWIAFAEALIPGWFAGASLRVFAVIDTWPDWYIKTAVSLSLFAYGADQLAKLPKSWGRK